MLRVYCAILHVTSRAGALRLLFAFCTNVGKRVVNFAPPVLYMSILYGYSIPRRMGVLMLAKLRTRYSLVFSALVVVVFAVVGQLCLEPWSWLVEGTGFLADDAVLNDAVFTLFYETVCALVMLLILWGTGRLDMITRRGSGLKHGLGVGAAMLAYAVVMAGAVSMVSSTMGFSLNPPLLIALSALSYLFVGVAEEFMARSIVAETLLEHFGTSRAGALKAMVASGILFGLLHVSNCFTVSMSFGIPNVISATALGMVLAAVYFRCGNIWTTVILHGVYDIGCSAMIVIYNVGTIQDAANLAGGTDSSPIFTIVTTILKFALAFWLLRKAKADEVKTAWAGTIEE